MCFVFRVVSSPPGRKGCLSYLWLPWSPSKAEKQTNNPERTTNILVIFLCSNKRHSDSLVRCLLAAITELILFLLHLNFVSVFLIKNIWGLTFQVPGDRRMVFLGQACTVARTPVGPAAHVRDASEHALLELVMPWANLLKFICAGKSLGDLNEVL